MPKEGTFWFYFNKEQLKKLIEIFGTNNKEELKRKIEAKIFDEKPQTDESTKSQRLKNLKLMLECWHQLKSMNVKQEQIVALLTNQITIEELTHPALPKEKDRFRGLDTNGYCGTCFHNHFISNKICCRDNCNCGIRG